MINIKNKDFIDIYNSVYYQFLTENSVMKLYHSHDFWEIFIVLKGSINHNIGTLSEVLKENTAILIHPNDIHSLEVFDVGCRFLNIAITDELMQQICIYLEFKILDFNEIKTSIQLNLFKNEINNIIERLNCLDSINGQVGYVGIENKMISTEIVFTLIKAFSFYKNNVGVPAWFRNLLNEMVKPENIEMGIVKVSKRKGYGIKSLNLLLKKHLNITSNIYSKYLKLNYAANLLINSDMDILSISISSGYRSVSHFTKIFKTFYEITPSQYRKKKNTSKNVLFTEERCKTWL